MPGPCSTNGRFYAAGLRITSPGSLADRLKAIRMLRKQPIDVALIDRRLAPDLPHHLRGTQADRKEDAYDDLKCDLATIDLEKLREAEIRTRWPREFSANDTEKAKGFMLDLIARVVEASMKGIRDARSTQEEVAACPKTTRRWRSIRRRRASSCNATRCSATGGSFINAWGAFWKHRRKWSGRRRDHEQEQAGIRRGAGRRTGRA